jgi:bifunctional DNA-binding transcriptional regulator/antitoxin component of YhaV-PrlF toxin-antitoxin module
MFQEVFLIPSSGLIKTRIRIFIKPDDPKMFCHSYNIAPHHKPKELQHQFHRGESLR